MNPDAFYLKGEKIMNNIFKTFLKYVSLNILGMTAISCYILADTYFIAQGLGANGLTALNLALPVFNFIHGIGLMLGMGGASKYSIYKSRGESKNADKYFLNTLISGAIISIIIIFLGITVSKNVTHILGADEKTFDMTHIYLKMLMLFSPAFIFNNIFLCFIRNDNAPALSMTAMITGSLSNVVLDYLFIFPFSMGMFGAILATCLSPVISLAIMFTHHKNSSFSIKNNTFCAKTSGEIISLGFPSFVSEAAAGTVIIVFNILILGLNGNTGVAAYGVITNLACVTTAVFTGAAQGVQPLFSYAYGKSNIKNIRQLLKYTYGFVIIISLVIYTAIFFNSSFIVKAFNSENNAWLAQIADIGLKLYFTSLIFAGFNIATSVLFTSIEKPLFAQIISLLRGFAVIIPLSFFMAHFFGLTGVWLCVPLTEAVVFAVATVFIIKNLKKL